MNAQGGIEILFNAVQPLKTYTIFFFLVYIYIYIYSIVNDKILRCKINNAKMIHIGENDSYIYSLIRQGLTEEFISYTNGATISLSSKIQPSIFEKNLFLMQKTPTLIEYAVFFGSIKIIQYLQNNNISLTNSLWLFAVHSDNLELIHFLEENKIKLQDNNQNIF